jgi:hypothetical protein
MIERYMKHQLLMKFLLILGIFFLVSGFSKANEKIEMKRFSLSLTPGKDWTTTIAAEDQTVVFEKIEGGVGSSILVREVDASKVYGDLHSERWVADAYRRGEEANMIARGVMEGQYELRDARKRDVKLDGKNLYAMTYMLVWKTLIGHGYLYLYFPNLKKPITFTYFYTLVVLSKRSTSGGGPG